MVTREFLKTRHQNIPGLETVTYTSPTGTATTGVTAERRPVDRRAAGLVVGSTDELQFILHDVSLSGVSPSLGGTITDASSVIYTIQSLSLELLGTRHRCIVTKNRG